MARISLSLAALVVALSTLPASAQEAASTTLFDANKAVVRRYLDEVLSAGKLDKLDELVSSDFVDRTPGAPPQGRGPAVIRASQERARALFQDIRYSLEDIVAEGDRVVARYTVRATRKPAEGSSDPGPSIEVMGITLFRVSGGQIQEAWIVNDQIEMFRQLGFTLQPPRAEPPKNDPPAQPPADAPAG